MDERTIDPLVNFLLLLEAMGNFLGEGKAEIANSLTLENFLWLVELLPHQCIKVVIEHEILKFGKLLRK